MKPVRAARWLVDGVAWMVPAHLRREWRRDWHAELAWYADAGHGAWHQCRRARGAWRHAIWLRAQQWRTGAFGRDVRQALRTVAARPAFAAVAVATLALGIGANTAIFSVVHALLLRELPYPQPEQLVSIYATHRRFGFDRGVERPEDIQYWMNHAATTSAIAPIGGGLTTVTTGGEPDRVPYAEVTPAFFEVMRVAPALGRVFTAAEAAAQARIVVVTHAIWQRRLAGATDLTMLSIDLDGQRWEVIGVMPADFRFPAQAAMWRPFDFSKALRAWHLGSVARLKPGVTVAAAQREFDAMAAALEREFPKARQDRGFNVVGLREDLAYRSIAGVRLLQGAVALVLLIACANVANLMLAQASGRLHEFGIRAALGGSRLRLIRQCLTESVLLSVLGAAVGAGIAVPAVRALVAAAPPLLFAYPDQIGVNWAVLAFTGAVAIATGVLFGLAPAVRLSAPRVAGGIGHGLRTAGGSLVFSRQQMFRAALIGVETALAFLLLVGGGLLIRSFALLSSQEPGFRTDHLLTAQLSLPAANYPTSEARMQFWTALVGQLSALPRVRAVVTNTVPFSNWEWQADFTIAGREDVPNTGVGLREVGAGYFDIMGIRILRGRAITAADRSGAPPIAVVSDVFAARHMSGLDPLGHRLRLDGAGPWLTIVGVAASVRHMNLGEDLRPEIYVPARQREGQATMHVALRTEDDPLTLAAPLRSVVASLDPRLPLQSVKTMAELIAVTTAERRFLMTLLALFAGLAAALAAVGVYGVISVVVSQGRREIGIRLALGARPAQLQRRLVGQGLAVVGAGAAVGLVAALATARVLASQLFETRPNDPSTIASAAALLLTAAAIACWIPARRTSRVEASESLRQM